MLLDDGQVVAGAWGVPLRWDGASGLHDGGYDGALITSVAGHENDVTANTLCVMAAAVRAGRQGTGLAGKALTALRERAAGLARMARDDPQQLLGLLFSMPPQLVVESGS